MAESLVKFSLQRFKSLLLEESWMFLSLEDQAQSLLRILDEIGCFYDTIDRTKENHHEFEVPFFHKLRDRVHDMEDCVDEFIVRMNNQKGCDQNVLIDFCRIELEKIGRSLVHIMKEMREGKKVVVEAENKDAMEISSQVDEGETPSSRSPFKFYHSNIPYHLRSCLMYCCIFPEDYAIPKKKLVRMLVAEGLVQEKPGEIVEDVAEENIKELVNLGLLHMKDETKLEVCDKIYKHVIGMIVQENFLVSCSNPDTNIPPSTRRLSIHSDTQNIPPNLDSLPIRSLFMFGIESISDAEFENLLRPIFSGKKLLRVLDIEGVQTKALPDEVGDLIHLRYLGLDKTGIDELPESVTELRNLQTLDIRMTGKIKSLSSGILKLEQLRHLKMLNCWGICGVRLPEGIGGLKNLQTLTGIYAGGGIAEEIGKLTQLRKLGIMDFTQDLVHDLCASITKMKGLLSLSLSAKHCYPEAKLPSIEPFSPPPLLRKLCLEGELERLPTWISSMANLSQLRLGFSKLPEDPALVLQSLPNLKSLTLWHAYETKTLGREFCGIGGFPKLELLYIASLDLEEWTEIVEGAFPSLTYLHFHSCLKLRMLPEGLQHLTKLEKLRFYPLLDEHEERLKPNGGAENYKISHIPSISFITSSAVQGIVARQSEYECA